MRNCLLTAVAALSAIALAGCSSSNREAVEATPRAPDIYHINLDTSKGAIVIEVRRDWAPIGADHLYDLVKRRYYDGARFFRVLPSFVVQFGLAADPALTKRWVNTRIPDDPVTHHNVAGTITYATAGPGTRTTQLFINMADNLNLDGQGFSPLGEVVTGMDVVHNLYSGYGEGAPNGNGPDQSMITSRGNEYLQAQFPQLDYIRKATVQ